ncbi:hypothetical protein [Haliea sp. E17]|uniref:hypothetical protein n=1 Tax=Haliea sp. E17 TaxID=3401576 RepID=UPI003AB062A1
MTHSRCEALFKTLIAFVFVTFGSLSMAETVEQKVWIKPVVDANGQCTTTAYFKGEQDNCSNHDAHGRADCPKDTGCVCTRQEKHITWEMDGDKPFTVAFDRGDDNPFVTNGSNECDFKGNKKGKLRCRVKEKDTPKGLYRYTVGVPDCKSAQVQLKLY